MCDSGALCFYPSAGKPLANLAGKPMIQRVYERAAQAKIPDEIIVATDDERIKGNRGRLWRQGHDDGGYAPVRYGPSC